MKNLFQIIFNFLRKIFNWLKSRWVKEPILIPKEIFDWLRSWKSEKDLLKNFNLVPDKKNDYTEDELKIFFPEILLLLVVKHLEDEIAQDPRKQIITTALASNPCLVVEDCSLIEALHRACLVYPNFELILYIDDTQESIDRCINEEIGPVLAKLPQDIRPYFIPGGILCEFYLLTSTTPITPEHLSLLNVSTVLTQTEQMLRKSFDCFTTFLEILDCETTDEFVTSLRMVPQKLRLENIQYDLETLKQKYL